MSPHECSVCGRSVILAADSVDWIEGYVSGRLVIRTCPDCATPEQAVDADRNDARLGDSTRTTATEVRVLDTATFARLNAAAVSRESISVTDEAIDGLTQDAQHACVASGGYSIDDVEYVLVWALMNAEVEDVAPVVSERTEQEIGRRVEIHGATGSALLEVSAAEWIGFPVSMLADDGELHAMACKAAADFFARHGADL